MDVRGIKMFGCDARENLGIVEPVPRGNKGAPGGIGMTIDDAIERERHRQLELGVMEGNLLRSSH